jgi:hypothetical protein
VGRGFLWPISAGGNGVGGNATKDKEQIRTPNSERGLGNLGRDFTEDESKYGRARRVLHMDVRSCCLLALPGACAEAAATLRHPTCTRL